MKTKSIALITVAVIAVLGLMLLPRLFSGQEDSVYSISVGENDWVRGTTTAPVILVEYSDFQCPACGAYYPMVKSLKQEFGDDVAFVYRHFPLMQTHPFAEPAARAAEAAGAQSKFWEMHDLLFENQSTWSRASNPIQQFSQYAETLGLDLAQFAEDFESDAAAEKVQNDLRRGVQLGVNSTPTFFLNGKKLQPRSLSDVRDAVAEELEERKDKGQGDAS